MYCMLTFQHSSDVFTFITTYIMDHEIWYCLMFQHRSIMLSASLLTTLILALLIAALPVEVHICISVRSHSDLLTHIHDTARLRATQQRSFLFLLQWGQFHDRS